MTTEEVLKKLKVTPANKWDLIFNWIKQGEIRSKTFRKLIETLIKEQKNE